jgi:predicted Zn-dependent protease
LAGVLTAAGRHADALALLEELARANPDDSRFQGQLAQATLWSGDAPRALERLHKLLAIKFEQPELWVSYVEAAAGLDKGRLTGEQLQMMIRLADRPVPDATPDKVLYLSRLAWVLHREEYREKAGALLDQAVALQPTDPKVRRELAGVLVAAGKNEAGLRQYEGLTLDLEDRFQLMVLHAAAKQFGQAESQCQLILKDRPTDAGARQWLADLALWGNQYAKALDLYHEILTANFEQPRLWPRYVEAASFADHPTEDQVRLALRISERSAADTRDPLLLAWMALVQYRHVDSRLLQARLGAGVVGMMAPVGLVPAPLLCLAPGLADQSRETTARTWLRRAAELRPKEPTVLARLSWVGYQMGQQFLSSQLLDEAIALKPTEPAVRREIGDVLVATERLREGLRWFEDPATAFPMNRDFQVRLAEVTVWAGEYVQGLGRVEKVLGTDLEPESLWHTFVDAASSATSMTPGQIQVALRLAGQPVPGRGADEQAVYLSRLSWALYREGERARPAAWNRRVNALLDQALALKPRATRVRTELAAMLTAARRFGDVAALYEGLLRESPGDPDLLVRLAEVTLWGGNVTGGLARFEQLLRDNVQRPGVWKGFAEAAAAAPALTGAETELALRLAEQAPLAAADERVPLLARLARALSREAKRTDNGKLLARADAAAGQAVKLDPKKPEDCRELAAALAAMGKTRQALELLDRAGPGDVAGRVLRICLLADGKDLDRAEMEARALAREKPDDPEAQLVLADVLSWNGKLDEAAALLGKLREANRDDPRLPRRLAEVALWAGRYEQALGRYLALLEADWHQPDLWPAYIDAASGAREVSGENKKMVLRIYESGSTALPKDAARLARFAWVLRRLGEPRKGVRLLRQALELEPRSREVRARLAEALQELGEFTEAERHYAVLLRTPPARR